MKPTIDSLINILYMYDVAPGDSVPAIDYTRLMNGIKLAFGDKFKAWFMDCFIPDGEQIKTFGVGEDKFVFDFFSWEDLEEALKEFQE